MFSIFRKIRNRKIEVVSEVIDERISSLNSQIKPQPFINKKGCMSVDVILNNHYALFKNTLNTAGKLRESEVYIKCYKKSDNEGGAILVQVQEDITNLLPSTEVHLTLKDIVTDWNKKVGKVKGYSQKEKIEFISRFHLYFEMIHPFLDGNGRIGRMIINDQLTFLFDKILEFKPDLKIYHEAINMASKGDESGLRLIIQEQVDRQCS